MVDDATINLNKIIKLHETFTVCFAAFETHT